MRGVLVLVALTATLGGCRSRVDLIDTGPARAETATTSIWGDWLLATPPDSTVFQGASTVELVLNPGTFVITANYAGRAPVVVRGSASLAETSLLTLVPEAGSEGLTRSGAVVMAPGQPLTLQATAAGGSLIFAAPSADVAVPSSVWHRKDRAKAAGQVTP